LAVAAPLYLPRHLNTTEAVYYGGVIFEGEPFGPVGRAARVKGLNDELDALRMILLLDERAMFEFIVTEANLREVEKRDELRYTQWVYNVPDTWLIQSAYAEPLARHSTIAASA
jgi:hypothetical protein